MVLERFASHDCREKRRAYREFDAQIALGRAPRLAEIRRQPLWVETADRWDEDGDPYLAVLVNGVALGEVREITAFPDVELHHRRRYGWRFNHQQRHWLYPMEWELRALLAAHPLPRRPAPRTAFTELRAAVEDCLAWLREELPADTEFTGNLEGRPL